MPEHVERKGPWGLILVVCLLSLLALACPAPARALQPPSPREALIQAIQDRARRDVELGKPAEGVAGLEVLFGQQAADAGMSMAEVLEVYESAYTTATPAEPWWAPLTPLITWAGIAALAVLIFQNLLKDALTRFFKWIWEGVYKRLAGFRPFWWIALRRYRRALVERYRELKIPFRSGRPLDMQSVYVPLKVAGTGDLDPIDAYQAIAEHKRLMVVGAPGSGKSMLFRHIALTYAQGEWSHFPTRPIPILVELNRLGDSNISLSDHLVEVLHRPLAFGGSRGQETGWKHKASNAIAHSGV